MSGCHNQCIYIFIYLILKSNIYEKSKRQKDTPLAPIKNGIPRSPFILSKSRCARTQKPQLSASFNFHPPPPPHLFLHPSSIYLCGELRNFLSRVERERERDHLRPPAHTQVARLFPTQSVDVPQWWQGRGRHLLRCAIRDYRAERAMRSSLPLCLSRPWRERESDGWFISPARPRVLGDARSKREGRSKVGFALCARAALRGLLPISTAR